VVSAVALAAAACGVGEAAQPDPVQWSVVEKLLHRPAGSYTKTITIESGSERHLLMREWVAYNLRRNFIDRRIGLGDDPTTPAVEKPARRAAPSLRFVYGPKRVLMWNANVRKKCGTPWVEMPARLIAEVTGFRLRDLSVVEPDAILRRPRGEPRVVSNDDRATVYEVPVIGTAGFSAASILRGRPELLPALERETSSAHVRIARDGGPIEIMVDPTSALESALGRSLGDERMTVRWRLQRASPRVDTRLPKKVAGASCLS